MYIYTARLRVRAALSVRPAVWRAIRTSGPGYERRAVCSLKAGGSRPNSQIDSMNAPVCLMVLEDVVSMSKHLSCTMRRDMSKHRRI